VKTPSDKPLVEWTLPMTREQAEAIYALGKEAVIFVMLQMAAQLAPRPKGKPDPSTPSGMVPPHEKESKPKRRKKRGGKKGHTGKRRDTPAEITRHERHAALKQCPDCGEPLGSPASTPRYRLIEDLIETEPEVVQHEIPRTWCGHCRKWVEPPVVDAMAKATLGHRLVALTAWLHYGLGVTISQVLAVLNHHLHFSLTAGGAVDAWQRLSNLLFCWYEQIGDEVRASGVLHADETGWRVNGKSVWLWCFTTKRSTYYMIHQSRGSPALSEFFTSTFNGVLVTDFWAAYNAVACADRQVCIPHLLRELTRVDERDASQEWTQFSNKLKRLMRDGLRLKRRDDLTPDRLKHRALLIDRRLTALVELEPENANVRRLVKRLRKHREAFFAFLDYEDVPPDNNHAEREIRPAVIIRKNSLCNQSEKGANVQAIMMSVYRTLHLRGIDPLDAIVAALKEYVRTGSMPPLPDSDTTVR